MQFVTIYNFFFFQNIPEFVVQDNADKIAYDVEASQDHLHFLQIMIHMLKRQVHQNLKINSIYLGSKIIYYRVIDYLKVAHFFL